MFNLIFKTIFIFATLYYLAKAISYAIYEIKTEKNKSGGITIITFSILVIIFTNIVICIR